MERKQGILVNARIKKAGITIYTRKGQTIIRPAISDQPPRRTLAQFLVRERMGHNRRLFNAVQHLGFINQPQFCALAAKLPALYLTREEHFRGYTLLLPGIPVSCGTLPDIGQRLATVDGTAALLTDLTPALLGGDRLTMVALEQTRYGGLPKIRATASDAVDTVLVDGHLALVGDRYGEPDRGWALVRRRRGLCSTQTVVTAATAYREYLTSEALERAAESYGGLTG